MESETSNGYGSEKRESDGGGGLGLKLQRTGSFPYKMMMNQNRQFDNSAGDGGPSFEVYDGVGLGVAGGVVARTLQPFKGGMAATSLRLPFTSAQWMELERQALIYKHMVASVPIPSDLLLPLSRNLSESVSISASHPALGRGSCFNLRFSSNPDLEPGRCKRTDGKKWRCSRDVAPDQKYCERHMNRGRPRSRKHVEVPSETNNNNISNIPRPVPPTTPAANTTNTTSNYVGSSRRYNQPYGFSTKPDFKSPPFETMTSPSPFRESRSMEWALSGSNVPMAASNHDLVQFMQGKSNSVTNSHVLPQHYQEGLNLNSYTAFGEAQQQNDQCFSFLNTEFSQLDDDHSLHSDERNTPRRFIDAWSNARDDNTTIDTNKSSSSAHGKLSPSTLSLSMSGDNGGLGEDIDQIPMGLNLADSDRDNSGGLNIKSPPLSWMTPVSWMSSPPGGPLGEVLQSSAKGSSNLNSTSRNSSTGGRGFNLMTDGWGGSTETSPRGTALSSPSGVLQKTLVSLSDSSGNSSPTFVPSSKSEIALQWMSLSKLPST